MISMTALVRNEVLKIWKKKRFLVLVLIMLAIVPLFTYAQYRVAQNLKEQFGTTDWRVTVEQRIKDYSNRLSSPRVTEEFRRWLQVEIQRLEYHLDAGIDPESPNGVTFTREFMKNAVHLMLPLMVMVIASDLVSSEHALGTIKLLVTRPARRWQVLTAKYAAMLLYTSLIVVTLGAICYAVSGLVFGYGGWKAPVLTGFTVEGSVVDLSAVRIVEQWRFLWMEFGLAWFSAAVVGCIALMVSVLIRSTAAGMGVMLAALIAGTILTNMASSWESAKYFFMVNLQTIAYLSGELPPVPGMTLPFSLGVLGVTAAASVVVSYAVFTRKDIFH